MFFMYQIYIRRRDRSIPIYTQRKNRGPYGQLLSMVGQLGWPLLLFSSLVFSFALEDEPEADLFFLTSGLEGNDDELLVLLVDEPLEEEDALLFESVAGGLWGFSEPGC